MIGTPAWAGSTAVPVAEVETVSMTPGWSRRIAVHAKAGELLESDCSDHGVTLTLVEGTRKVNRLEIAWDAAARPGEGVECDATFRRGFKLPLKLQSVGTGP
jgi:hypothetical protein